MLTPDDLPLLASFAAVVRAGSFTAAARARGLTKSAVSQQVSLLEARCGSRLLDRSTRHHRLTEPGAEVLRAAGRIDTELRALQLELESRSTAPVGNVRVATTHDLAVGLVAPVAAALLARHPMLQVEILADDAVHDIIAAGFDLSVRLGTPRDSAYTMRRLGQFDEPVVAAPEVARRLGPVSTPADLGSATWVQHTLLAETLTFHAPGGASAVVRPQVRARANSGHGVRALLLGGAGVGVLPSYQVDDHLRRGELVELCPGWSLMRLSLYALWPAGGLRPAVRAFLDALAAGQPQTR